HSAPHEAYPLDRYPRIAALRGRLKKDPRQALAWANLALEYASLGLRDKAKRAMNAGLSLAPSNRFLLRSAARLRLHLNEPEEARALLLRQPKTRHDPWLLSAEIAIATVLGKPSRLIRDGREMVEGAEFAPAHLAELASALGTVELLSGKTKAARKLFHRSLEAPTDNSVAQAVWASRELGSLG